MFTSFSLDRCHKLICSSSSLRIGVIGDVMLDTYISGTASRLSQEAPVPVLLVRDKNVRPGGAANVMRNLKALSPNAEVHAFGITGADRPGEILRDLLQKSGVYIEGILPVDNRITIEKQRVIAENQQVVRMDFEDTAPVPQDIQMALADAVSAEIRAHKLDALIIEDYAKGLIGQEMLQQICRVAEAAGIFTSLDPHPGNPVCTEGLSLMTPNRQEAFALAGVYCSSPVDRPQDDMALRTVAEKIFRKWKPKLLLITLGSQGMALYSGENLDGCFIPTIAKEVFDVSGAGDTVISAFTLYCAAGATPAEAAIISNQAAGIVVGKAGTATTDPDEIMASFRAGKAVNV